MRGYAELAGRAAIVTGASRGIGAATARLLAAHGVHVVLAARGLAPMQALVQSIRATGGSASAIACDVSDWTQVEAAVASCESSHGRVDILVNNAAVIEPIARIADADPNAWAAATDINLKGVFFAARAVLPVMLRQRSGVIVNVSSGAATRVQEGWSQYCASKAAVLSLTRSLHLEYQQQGIRVLGLSPGTVATEMQAAIRASGLNPVSRLDPSAHIAAEDAARAIAWLCTRESDDCLGEDFVLSTPQGRRRVGLAPR
ncbi:MAG: SDR family oxidoreductase [Gammaproteobacteria bacterium]|nr:SDR family oxidoreductase [Gammaproteobacteria bacterium]